METSFWFLTMALGGALGGVVNAIFADRSDLGEVDEPRLSSAQRVIVGAIAATLVPLFLKSIGNDLIASWPPTNEEYLVFFSFCVLAGIFSRQFIATNAEKQLKDAVRTSRDAMARARSLEPEVRRNEADQDCDLAREYYHNGEYETAIEMAQRSIDHTPTARAYQFLAASHFALERFEEALAAARRCLEHEAPSKRERARYQYNFACYASRFGEGLDEAVEHLAEAVTVFPGYVQSVHEDPDLAVLRDHLGAALDQRFPRR